MKNSDMPALPVHEDVVTFENGKAMIGMTKRETFAMAAMQGLLSAGQSWSANKIASRSVIMADGLLAELEK